MEKEIISSRQFMIITLLFSIGTAILIIPASVTSEAKQDAWIAAIIGVVLSLPIVKLFVALGNRTPTLTFVEANEKILGRFFGKFTTICFIIISLLSAGELLYFIEFFMKTEIMPETPTMAFAFMFSIIIIYAAFLGIEVFARSAEILFPIFILIFIFFVIFISPSIHIENLQPIMETPKKLVFFSMIRFISLFSFPLAVLLMIFPSAVNVQKSAQKGFYIGTIIGGIVLITIITLSILVLGPANTASRTFPSYSLAQRISIGNFLQRIEVIMAAMWIISIYIRTFMYFYASVIGIAQLFKIKNHRPLIFPLGMIILGLSQIVHPNNIHSDIYNRETWPIFSFIFMILLPLFLLLIAKIRKINGNQENTTQCNSSTQNESGSNNGNASQSDSNSNSENASQSDSSSKNGNSSQSQSSNNGGNASQSEISSNSENTSQNESSSNSGNASQSNSSSNSENASQSDSSSNSENSAQCQNSSNGGNASQSEISNNNENSAQSESSSNGGNSTQNESNCKSENTSQNESNSNGGNASQNESSSNSGNASQSESSSNNENASQSESSSNGENSTQNKSENDAGSATQNDSDTGNTPNSDKNKDSSEN
ncbi:endospore germination permease [Lysinibacillus agricola]|uniref:Endospore germination permease n=2 Tax=Lysinibacillus agricola TaxID=2590012 RepID=A0ABX7B1M2_9BACI|nr:endospore germination permease [Lysinibacillus agricola]